ncbi:nucleoside-diphosphate-sugar epimerase [Desulfocurvibacter africanus PCS]|uniref:Nucleoside-diphosphate-sugar epimerase n=1 Tax=Desulfocurvibacter africanus PCS TaxID=1262666 RepID=M5PYJ2_DESAF|nr:SDR family oxidoreductase [Desulfocurvibacter africanus]EMG39080.1 nucleoside-diphosphate-sugar epimerase [Desulfocurvibacter africanus PCS]
MDLVIGGSGFIGSHLVSLLQAAGRPVRVFDRKPWHTDLPKPAEIFLGDIRDGRAVQEAARGCERVFHLAANPMLWDRHPEVFDQVNRQGTENVIRAAREAKVRRLVYTSTESILTPRDHQGPITEDVRVTEEDQLGPYCLSKYRAERAVLELAASGFDAVVVNPTMPLGPGDRNLTPPGRMVRNFLQGKIKGYIDCRLNFVDVRDAAMGHMLAAERGVPGRRYILAGHNLSVKELLTLAAREAGMKPPAFRVPYGLALAFSRMEEWWGRRTGRQPMSSVTGVKLCRRSMAFDGSRTWRELGGAEGFRIRPLADTLRDTLRWHLEEMGR